MGVNVRAALRMLRERARQFVTRGMAECCRHANDELFALVEGAENAEDQTRYLDAMRIWHGAHRLVSAGLARRLDLALSGDGAVALEAAGTPPDGEPPRWVDGEDLTELIRVDAMAATVRMAMQAPLAELTARVEALTGMPLPPRQFAFAPDFVLSAFAREIAVLGLAADARRVLLRTCRETLLKALPSVAAQANDLLRNLGVTLPADDLAEAPAVPDAQVASKYPVPGVATATAGAEAPAPHSPPRRGSSRRLVATTWSAARPPGGGVEVPLVQVPPVQVPPVEVPPVEVPPVQMPLAQVPLAQVPLAEVPLAEVPLAEVPLAEVLRELAGQRRTTAGDPEPGLLQRVQAALATRGRQLDALHPLDRQLVALIDALFGILAAAWMPPALRELLATADIGIAELAHRDPQFLDQPWHPGRRLLAELMAAVTDLLDPDDYREAELFRCAAEMIAALGRPPAAPRRLAQCLAEFVVLVERERERVEQRAERILQEAAVQERTNLAHGRVAAVIGARLVGRVHPLALLDLMERAWCRVLFLAWFRYGDSAPQWRAAIHLLDQLVGLLGDEEPDPDLVERLWAALAESLDRIAFNRFEARRLLDDLRGCLAGDVAGIAYRPGVVWAPEEARELGDPRLRVAVSALRLGLPGEPETQDHRPEQSLSDVDLSRADSLYAGGWIELVDDASDEPMHARLLGVVQPSGMHLLEARNGGIHRLPKRRLALALKEGRLRARDNSRLFEQALDQALEQVSRPVGRRHSAATSATVLTLPVRRTL